MTFPGDSEQDPGWLHHLRPVPLRPLPLWVLILSDAEVERGGRRQGQAVCHGGGEPPGSVIRILPYPNSPLHQIPFLNIKQILDLVTPFSYFGNNLLRIPTFSNEAEFRNRYLGMNWTGQFWIRKLFFRRISLNVDVGVYKSLKTDKYPCYTKEELEEKGKHYLSRWCTKLCLCLDTFERTII